MSEQLTTQVAVEAVAWERAPRYPGRSVNRRIVCADGFAVSVQASAQHYAHDSSGGEAPYWQIDPEVVYPFTTFEIGNPSAPIPKEGAWTEGDYCGDGIWPWMPRDEVAALLDSHGGAVAWQPIKPAAEVTR